MGFWKSDDDQQNAASAYEQVQNAPHKAALSHELLAAAASYEAAKAYEKHRAAGGNTVPHAEAMAVATAAAGALIDRLVETKGLDLKDKYEAKRKAEAAAREQGIDDGN